MNILGSLLDSIRLKFAAIFKGQKQTITGNTGNVIAAQSRGGPATAGVTVTPVIEKIVMEPATSVEDIEKKIAQMIQHQLQIAGKKPGGILIDQREFSVLVRDIAPGTSRGKITVHPEATATYESVVTYEGIAINRIAGLGLGPTK